MSSLIHVHGEACRLDLGNLLVARDAPLDLLIYPAGCSVPESFAAAARHYVTTIPQASGCTRRRETREEAKQEAEDCPILQVKQAEAAGSTCTCTSSTHLPFLLPVFSPPFAFTPQTLMANSQPKKPAIKHISSPSLVHGAKAIQVSADEHANPAEHASTVSVVEAPPATLSTPHPDLAKPEVVSETQLHTLFSGAPHFSILEESTGPSPVATYPWNSSLPSTGLSDSICPEESAFSSSTLRQISPGTQHVDDVAQAHDGYKIDVVEMPSMLAAQGIEPGSIGFAHFLELPRSDSLITDLEGSQSSKEFLRATKNKELMQSSPERIGIRAVDMDLIYDRLIEFQDLCEAFHDSPEPMTILNHQSVGDLYANLFSKFLMPPGFDGSVEDPTGLQIQISTLVSILDLKGVWYDFSLVEWRIRLGQLLWSDPEPVPDHESHPLWTEREILLLQITLACELLLRLDAVLITNAHEDKAKTKTNLQDAKDLHQKKSRKVAWDLVLARKFMDNILVLKSSDINTEKSVPKSRGFFSMISAGEVAQPAKSEVILLPQHQARQLAGLLKFAEIIQWPNAEALLQGIVQKLGANNSVQGTEQNSSPSGKSFDPITPSSISVYGTPLQTPRSGNQPLDGYFGHIGKPTLSRDNSHSLRIPLSSTLPTPTDGAKSDLMNVGGWLSRSYLTGLVLPGESISHFLISTLLENDTAVIAKLGDSANLYGGFSHAGRTWWSKNSVVGRVFACLEDAVECMGWISFSKTPEGMVDCWHSIHSDQIPIEDRLANDAQTDKVSGDSAVVPSNSASVVRPEDFVLPEDRDTPPSAITFSQWDLTPLNPDLIDNDALSDIPTESEIHTPSVTFTSKDEGVVHTLTLAFDVQFVSSWKCFSPNTSPAPSMPQILKRSLTGTLSNASSKRSTSIKMSRRNSHGFEPLLSHPPDSIDIAPKPAYPAVATEGDTESATNPRQPVNTHPLHVSYKYKIVPVIEVLDPDFNVPFDIHAHKSVSRSHSGTEPKVDDVINDQSTVLVLDARSSTDLQLLARAWCAEKGYHAIIGRVTRTCLSCCIREARGLGLNVVIRV